MDKLLTLMDILPEELDAALVTSDYNRRYYTEFPSSAGTLVVTREQSYLIIDGRYFEAASQNAVNCEIILQDKLFAQITQLLEKHNALHVGLESDTVTITDLEEFKRKLPNFQLIFDRTLSKTINEQRAVKSPEEKALIEQSQRITDLTYDYALGIIREGMTEKEIALAMEMYSRQQGSEQAAFSFIVATGPNTSRPHAVPSDNTVKTGDLVLMDFGSTYRGYRSDMTRVVAVGEPSDLQQDVYQTVLSAQKEAMKHIRAGVPLYDVHMAAYNYIEKTPYKGLFTHGLGHSLGLEIHEPPNFNPAATEKAVVGNTITVEPGIYLPGQFGVRIEDIVYITQDGFEDLTHSPKENLLIL